jgi:hypothetical protein
MDGRPLVTVVILDGRPFLRISTDGKFNDLPLTDNQAKLILYQLADWITRK